jgi:class 3 adenylate cyclase
LRAAVAGSGGVEVDSEGDGLFFAFKGARSAIGACVAGQLALLAEPWVDGVSVAVRMGLHTGEGTPEDNNYQDLAVHQAVLDHLAG